MKVLRLLLAFLAAVVMTVTMAQAAKENVKPSEEALERMEDEMMEEAEIRELETKVAEADTSRRRTSLGWGLWGIGYPYYGGYGYGYGYPYGGYGYPYLGYGYGGYGLGRFLERKAREQ